MIVATSVVHPTWIQQFGPLLAALVALTGALLALFVSGRREASRSRLQREDDYRREQRQALAAVLVAAQTFRREAGALGAPEVWTAEGYERGTRLRDSAEEAMSTMLNQLTVARLLVHEPILQNALDSLYERWSASSALVHAVVDAFWDADGEGVAAATASLEEEWDRFGEAAAVLQSVALEELRPTIVSPND